MSNELKNRQLKGFEVIGTLILTAHEGEGGEYINGMMFSGGHAFEALDSDERMLLLVEMKKLIDHMIGGLSASIKEESN